MSSISSQPSWPPFQPTRDCSLGICSIYCTRWCYSLFPPPPPFFETDDGDDSGPSLSPLAIALIALAATAIILVAYYTLIYRFCRRWHHPSTTTTTNTADDDDPATAAGWQGSPQGGLDEALINKITVCRYRKADGLVGGANCSVCLSEFREDESLRLLPKCSHAFHVQCIDTWLKSHPNCPLCRAGIIWTSPPTVLMPPSSSERNRSGNQMNDLEIVVQDPGSDEQVPKDLVVPDASENFTRSGGGGGGGEGSQLPGSAGSSMSGGGGGGDQSQSVERPDHGRGRSGVVAV